MSVYVQIVCLRYTIKVVINGLTDKSQTRFSCPLRCWQENYRCLDLEYFMLYYIPTPLLHPILHNVTASVISYNIYGMLLLLLFLAIRMKSVFAVAVELYIRIL